MNSPAWACVPAHRPGDFNLQLKMANLQGIPDIEDLPPCTPPHIGPPELISRSGEPIVVFTVSETSAPPLPWGCTDCVLLNQRLVWARMPGPTNVGRWLTNRERMLRYQQSGGELNPGPKGSKSGREAGASDAEHPDHSVDPAVLERRRKDRKISAIRNRARSSKDARLRASMASSEYVPGPQGLKGGRKGKDKRSEHDFRTVADYVNNGMDGKGRRCSLEGVIGRVACVTLNVKGIKMSVCMNCGTAFDKESLHPVARAWSHTSMRNCGMEDLMCDAPDALAAPEPGPASPATPATVVSAPPRTQCSSPALSLAFSLDSDPVWEAPKAKVPKCPPTLVGFKVRKYPKGKPGRSVFYEIDDRRDPYEPEGSYFDEPPVIIGTPITKTLCRFTATPWRQEYDASGQRKYGVNMVFAIEREFGAAYHYVREGDHWVAVYHEPQPIGPASVLHPSVLLTASKVLDMYPTWPSRMVPAINAAELRDIAACGLLKKPKVSLHPITPAPAPRDALRGHLPTFGEKQALIMSLFPRGKMARVESALLGRLMPEAKPSIRVDVRVQPAPQGDARLATNRGLKQIAQPLEVATLTFEQRRVAWLGVCAKSIVAVGALALTTAHVLSGHGWSVDLSGQHSTPWSKGKADAHWLVARTFGAVLGQGMVSTPPPTYLESVEVEYVPHALSSVLSEYRAGDKAGVDLSVEAKLLRLGALPDNDTDALEHKNGTAAVARAISGAQCFQSGRRTSPRPVADTYVL